jgi:hypothetical protein
MREIVLCFLCGLVACAVLGPADRAGIIDDAAKIEHCQELGRACHLDGGSGPDCYKAYSDCMADGGLR